MKRYRFLLNISYSASMISHIFLTTCILGKCYHPHFKVQEKQHIEKLPVSHLPTKGKQRNTAQIQTHLLILKSTLFLSHHAFGYNTLKTVYKLFLHVWLINNNHNYFSLSYFHHLQSMRKFLLNKYARIFAYLI